MDKLEKKIISNLCKKKNRLFFLFIFFAFFLPINTLFSQNSILNKKINIELNNISIEKALSKIEKKINYYFTYDEKIIDSNLKITLILKKEKLQTCLDTIFFNKSLYYKIIDNHIIIKSNKEIPADEIEAEKDTLQKSIELRALVLDEITQEAIPFATVSLRDYSIGVITNIQGEFVLKIPPSLSHQEIIISHIGYENKFEIVDNIKNRNTVFQLKQSFVSIQEVIIRKTDAVFLIKSALKKTSENYSSKPNYMTAFYRESVQRAGEFMFFSEAVLKIYKSSYSNENTKDQIKVLKSRKMKNITISDTIVLKLKSGLQSAMVLDIVKNKIEFLQEENFIYYNYKMTDIVTYDNRTSYAIDFEQKENIIDALYKGTIYIDTENLAIIGAEFKINPQKVSKAQSNFVIKKTRGMKLRIIDTKYIVSYRLINNKFYLSHVRGELKIRAKKKKRLFSTLFETYLELAVSDIDSLNVKRFNRKETENLTGIFSELKHEYDEAFWEDYNFIKPEDSWQEAIKKVHRKLNK